MRDLGPSQRHLLRFAERYRGTPVRFVAEQLGVKERYARRVVETLVDRGAIVVVYDPWTRDRRVWTPEAHQKWVRVQQIADSRRQEALLYPPIRTGREGKSGH